MSKLNQYKKANLRKASVLSPGGQRPTGDPFESNFCLKPLAKPDEDWPGDDGNPLLFVCQMNLSKATEIPALLNGIALITFFADQEAAEWEEESGINWVIRAYNSLEGLVPMERPASIAVPAVRKKGFEARWQVMDDWPTYDDPARVVPKDFDDEELELENQARTKIGGWSSNVQSEQWWDYREHPANPKYCLQIASEPKVDLQWGDGGVLYIARGTAPGYENRWYLDFQGY